jgi:hypothetical protein
MHSIWLEIKKKEVMVEESASLYQMAAEDVSFQQQQQQ